MTSQTFFKGTPVELAGNFVKAGMKAPDFSLTACDLTNFTLADGKGKRLLLNIFPSIDTAVCSLSVRKFNEFASGLNRTLVLCISKDLPFAQSRFCGVEGLKNVRLDNKGINILGSPGAQARAIFNGEVSAVFAFGGTSVVMVRHGSYISVYCNLRSVSVSRGQKVSTRQTLGTLGTDNILQFQLRRETAKLNPEVWLGR